MKTLILILLFSLMAFADFSYHQYSQPENFAVHMFAVPGEILIADITSEMDGHQIVECMAVFQNENKYRLVGPVIGKKDIMKNNLLSMSVKKIRRGK